MQTDHVTLTASDGQSLAGFAWKDPSRTPIGVVQIAHGAAEHSARYERFAAALVDAGLDAWAIDHRAHGRTADEHGAFGVARPGGWEAIITDQHDLTNHVGNLHPDTPLVLFGHSMGSFIGQAYAQRWGDELAGLVLSGTSAGLDVDDDLMAAVEALGQPETADAPSEIIGGMFAAFNEGFGGDDATGFEWLSRDDDEVAAYVNDPWCGFALSNGYVADMLTGTASMWTAEAEAALPTDLPVLVTSGNLDPVGGGPGVPSARELAQRWRDLGLSVDERWWEEARHEILNEVNRDEVTAFIVDWIVEHVQE